MDDDELNNALLGTALLLGFGAILYIRQQFGETISTIMDAEINIFMTGFMVSISWFIIGFIFIMTIPLAVVVTKRELIWQRVKFRYKHPLYLISGVLYLIPLAKKPSAEILDKTKREK